jgi:dynein regulatory complex protein 1
MNDQNKEKTQAERFAERRLRVAARKNTEGKSVTAKTKDKETEKKKSETKKQTEASRNLLDSVIDTALEEVTEVQINRDFLEIKRRKEEEAARRERSLKRYEESLTSAAINTEITAQWSEIQKHTVVDKLMDDLKRQFNKAGDLLVQKGKVITSLTTDLQSKDDAYVKLLAKHHEDITTMVNNMQTGFAKVLATSEAELEAIEATAIEERAAKLLRYQEELDAKFAIRRETETKIMSDKGRQENEYQGELALSLARNSEAFNSLKIELQNNIQLLEQQLEEMRAMYQLNTERLTYNRNVLQERNNENKETRQTFDKRLGHQKDKLAAQKARFKRENEGFKKANKEMTNDYKKMTEQFKDLQKKYHHFELVDTKKFREVWDMNEQTAMEYVHKILQADQIIHQQVLGLQWKPPGALGMEKGFVDIKSITPTMIFSAPLVDFEEAPGRISAADYLRSEVSVDGAEQENGENPVRRGKFSQLQLKETLQLIERQARFLIDARLQEELKHVPEDEAELRRIDAILVALGVEDKEDLDELVGRFVGEAELSDPSHDLESQLDPNDVVPKLSEFVRERFMKNKQPGTAKQTRTVQSQKKKRRKERERKFWTKLGMVVPEKTVRMWTALESAQREFNQVLEDRQNLIDETTELARHNEELKIVLQEYLSSKITQELEVPPTRLIRM